MKNRVAVVAWLVIVAASGVIMAAEMERWFGAFTPYPNVRELCDQHVSGNNMNITWRSYATRDPLAKVVQFYETDQKTKADVDQATGERKFAAASDADTILSIYPATAKIPTCPKGATKKEENTVIMVSQAVRPRK